MLRLKAPLKPMASSNSEPVMLKLDRAVGSNDGRKSAPGFDGAGKAIAAETLPAEIYYGSIRFAVPPAGSGIDSAMVPKGQQISLPKGTRQVYVLAAADGDQKATFHLDGKPFALTV